MNSIISYNNWLNSISVNSVAGRSYSDYLNYVSSQYESLKVTNDSQAEYAKEYIQFIKTLRELFNEDPETTEFLKNIDYDSQDEVRMSIPFYAENLRKIAAYLGERRKDPKSTASTHLDIDSTQYLKNTVYTEIANKIIQDNSISLSSSFYTLSSLEVSVEELYDDTKYHDKSPSMGSSFYYNITANESDYSGAFSIPSGLLEWTIDSGFNNTTSTETETSAISGYLEYDGVNTNTGFYNGTLSGALSGTPGVPQSYLGESQYKINPIPLTKELVISATSPIESTLNRYYPTVAMMPLIDTLYSIYDVGGYVRPKNLGVSIYHGKNREISLPKYEPDRNIFPEPTTFSNGRSLTKLYQNTPIYYNPTLNWMDIKYYTKNAKGVIGDSKKYQEMIPYKSDYEKSNRVGVGISHIIENVDPWNGTLDTEWADPVSYPPDFRKIYNVSDWEAALTTLNGYEYSWGIDIYGNNYALYKNTKPQTQYEFKHVGDGEIFIRGLDGYTLPFSSIIIGLENFSDINPQKIREMQIYYNTMIVVGETGCAVVQDLTLSDIGLPDIKTNSGHNFNYDVNLSEKDGYEYFEHFYDDRNSTLYVASAILSGGVVHLKLYDWKNGTPSKILDTTKIPIGEYSAIAEQLTSYGSANMDLNEERNQLIMTFVGVSTSNNYIINVIYDINRGTETVDVVYISPYQISTGSTSVDEPRNIIDINYFENKMIFVVEGSVTGNKYLQITDLDSGIMV